MFCVCHCYHYCISLFLYEMNSMGTGKCAGSTPIQGATPPLLFKYAVRVLNLKSYIRRIVDLALISTQR